ncbi:TPA: cupin domain-containing protein [Candidatus Dependentiae bacterium]|nr:cupin domain-containing protein [Candidatus Dependentiae bacterium]HBZ73752.1 cupin domain-containing protein [Candidatus Dependentiae bacterium]
MQLVNFAEKEWGHEEWIVNNDLYCGKKLILKKGFRCSMHMHKVKDETFYILSGKVLMETEFEGEKTVKIMEAGDIQHIKINMLHRFTGLEDSQIMEFSTFHMDSDSYRVEVSGKVAQEELNNILSKVEF